MIFSKYKQEGPDAYALWMSQNAGEDKIKYELQKEAKKEYMSYSQTISKGQIKCGQKLTHCCHS
jgi:hypothetical protein